MVWPLLAAGGIGAGSAILGNFFGSSKKEASVYHAPYETYAPVTTNTDARAFSIQYPDYNVIVNSPLSSAGSKKEMSTQQELKPTVTPTISPVGGSPTTGTNMTTIALIAGAAIIGYGLVRKK